MLCTKWPLSICTKWPISFIHYLSCFDTIAVWKFVIHRPQTMTERVITLNLDKNYVFNIFQLWGWIILPALILALCDTYYLVSGVYINIIQIYLILIIHDGTNNLLFQEGGTSQKTIHATWGIINNHCRFSQTIVTYKIKTLWKVGLCLQFNNSLKYVIFILHKVFYLWHGQMFTSKTDEYSNQIWVYFLLPFIWIQ